MEIKIPYVVDTRKDPAHLDMSGIEEGVKKMEQNRQPPNYTVLNPLPDQYQYDMNNFIERFAKIDSMSDSELSNLIQTTYISVLGAINSLSKTSGMNINNPYYVSLVGLFTNQRYICILSNIVRNTKLGTEQRVTLNRIIYNYITVPSEKKDSVIEKLLIDLADNINADILPTLIGIGLPKDLASIVAISSNSSMDDFINVKRVNLCIFNCGDTHLMTLQRIVDIYQNIFNKSVTTLFEGIMFDVYSEGDLKNATESQREIYSLQVTAVLEMINQMPSNSIRMILSSYYWDSMPYGVRMAVRSSISNLSNDYWRINEVLEVMKNVDNMYIM